MRTTRSMMNSGVTSDDVTLARKLTSFIKDDTWDVERCEFVLVAIALELGQSRLAINRQHCSALTEVLHPQGIKHPQQSEWSYLLEAAKDNKTKGYREALVAIYDKLQNKKLLLSGHNREPTEYAVGQMSVLCDMLAFIENLDPKVQL